jgi:hypothetical protein
MLYLNTLENQATNQTEEVFTLCHEGLRNLVELVPSNTISRSKGNLRHTVGGS